MRLRPAALALLALFAASAASAASTAPDPAAHLAGAHAAKGVTCESCHKPGTSLTDGEREVNASLRLSAQP